jgi:hypothetical protein
LLAVAIVEELELIWCVGGVLVCFCQHATHTLKSVPTLPRQEQTTLRCNGYQML